ncbi:hypothetical protein [Pseudoalteromonas phage PH357]|nr:hypothetical protein [Pseudoalteromonas phage PH357]
MNIFYTDSDPFIAASHHNTIHTRKMIVEYAQLLSTAHHLIDGDNALQGIYSCTHKNHPSAIWCRSGQYQYEWVLDCAIELCRLYTLNTGKIHKTESILEKLKTLPKNITVREWTDPPIAAPDKFKMQVILGTNICKAYQNYLLEKFEEWRTRTDKKPMFAEWWGDAPEWVKLK